MLLYSWIICRGLCSEIRNDFKMHASTSSLAKLTERHSGRSFTEGRLNGLATTHVALDEGDGGRER